MLIIDKLANDLVHWGRLVWEKGSGPPYPFPLTMLQIFLAGGLNDHKSSIDKHLQQLKINPSTRLTLNPKCGIIYA